MRVRLPRLIINAPYGMKCPDHSHFSVTFSSVAEKTGHCREVILAVGETVVERFKQESMYGLFAPAEQNEVAVVERWPL